MEKKTKIMLMLAAAALVIAIGWVVFSVPDEPKVQEAADPGPKLMEYSSNTIKEEKNGKVLWEITAEQTKMNVDTQDTIFQNVTGKYYQQDGKMLTITAPHGVYNSKTRNVKLDSGVKAFTGDGDTLDCASLEWVADAGNLIATGRAKLVHGDAIIMAERIEAYDEFNAFKASGHARIVKGKD